MPAGINNLSAFTAVDSVAAARGALLSRELTDSTNAVLAAGEDLDIYKLTIVQNRDSAPATPGSPPSTVIKAWLPDMFNQDVVAEYDTPFSSLLQDRVASVSPLLKNAIRAQLGTALMTQDMSVQVWSGSAPWDFSLPFVFMADEGGAVADVASKIKALKLMITPGRMAGGFLTAPGPTIDLATVATQAVQEVGKAVANTATGFFDKAGNFIHEKLASSSAYQTITDSLNSIAQSEKDAYGPAVNMVVNAVKKTTKSVLPQRNADKAAATTQAQGNGDTGQASSRIKNRISLHVGRYMYFPAVIVTSVGETYNTIFDAAGIPVRCAVNVNFRTMITPTKQELDQMFRF